MRDPLTIYQKNVESLRTLEAVYSYLKDKATNLDVEEILRAEYVMIVSAFDCFIHDMVRFGIINIFSGQRSRNKAYDKFSISMEHVKMLIDNPSNQETTLAIFLKQILSKDSFQSPSSIEYAMNLISIDKIWTNLKSLVGKEPTDIKRELALIIRRRNQIVHEADLNDSILETKNAISISDVRSVENLITMLVKGINTLYQNAQM